MIGLPVAEVNESEAPTFINFLYLVYLSHQQYRILIELLHRFLSIYLEVNYPTKPY